MSETYTPSSEDIKTAWASLTGKPESFNRWIEEHDRELSERRWEEGRQAGKEDTYYGEPVNPYLKYD